MMSHFGVRAILAVVASTALYFFLFRSELRHLSTRPKAPDVEEPEKTDGPTLLPVPLWLVLTHAIFMAWTVFNSHSPALFVGGFLFFLGFVRATAVYQSRIDLKTRRPGIDTSFPKGYVTRSTV